MTYLLHTMYGKKTLRGSHPRSLVARLVDLRPREWVVIVPMIVVAILMGVFPNIFLKPTGPSVERMLNQVQQGSAPAKIEARAAR